MVRLPDATDQIRLAPLRALRAVFSGVGQLLLAADRLREEDARQGQESGDGRQDKPASWDGRLSSSVRLISSSGMPARNSSGATSTPGGRSERTDRKSERGGRSKQANGRSRRAGQPGGKTTARKTGAADAERADLAGTRKSGRSKNVTEPTRFRSLDLTGNVRMLSDQDIADLTADQLERATDDTEEHESGQASGAATTETAAPSWSEVAPPWSSWSTSAQEAELPISGYDELSLPSLRARLRNLGPAELADLLAHERSHANRDDVVTMFERRIAKLADEG